VGRHAEVRQLERHLTGEAGSPLLLLAGEPGIGKSRLLHEAARLGRQRGMRVLHGGCARSDGQEPYAPLLGALAHHLQGSGGRWTPAQLRAALAGCAWLVRLLPELATGPIEPLPAWTLSPEQERRLMFGAVARFLANVAGPGGTLLLLDDLQWAGADALDLLGTLVRQAAEARLCVVGAYRHTEVRPESPLSAMLADLAHAGLALQHALPLLTPAEAAQLLDRLLAPGDEDTPTGRLGQALREQVVQQAGGVPFFLVSYARGLRAEERTCCEGGTMHTAVPWDVAHSVRQRVAVLPEAARQVLGAAAVIGRTAPYALLQAVAGRPEQEALAALEAAGRAGLLEEEGDPEGPPAYWFAHDVIREVVEADLSAARRLVLHRDIARALEQAAGEALDVASRVEELAYHYARTEEHASAALWLERAGDQAAAGFANAAALAHYAAARERLVAGRADAAAVARLDEKLGDLHLLGGEYGQAQERFAQARGGASAEARRAELWRKEGETQARRGEHGRALAAFAAGEAEGGLESATLPVVVRAALSLSQGDTHLRQHEYEAAERAARQAVDLLAAENPTAATDRILARAHLVGHLRRLLP
jgi:predicted ATPase